MKEVKTPKKPLLFYYAVALLVLFLFNLLAMPWLSEHQIHEVDYNTFVSMTEKKEIGQVEIQQQDNRILFTSTDGKTIYKTAMVPDDGLVQRLLDAGISTTGEEIQQTSLLMSILVWVLPLVIFIAVGQIISRNLMKKMGGGSNSLTFGMGKSNAKVYVQSTEGIKFADVAGEDEAKENLQEIVNYLHDPGQYQDHRRVICPRACCWWALRAPARPCWPRQWQASPTCRSSPCPARNSWRCSWAWAPVRCATCSVRPRRRRPASCSSTRSTPSARSAAAAVSTAATMSGSRH